MSYVVADVSNDPSAPTHVPVSEALRESVIELGCEHAGWLASWNGHFGFVSEVFGHATEPVVIAIYNFSSWGEGVAFWTMFDDGTVVTTDRFGKDKRLWALMTRVFPLHRKHTRFFNQVAAGTTKSLLEKHSKYARAVARPGSKPVSAPAFALYAAMRIRSGDMQTPRIRRFIRFAQSLASGLTFGVWVPFIAWVLVTHGIRRAIACGFPSFVIAMVVAHAVAPRLAGFLTRGAGDSSPVPPEVLLERASKIRRCNFADIKDR